MHKLAALQHHVKKLIVTELLMNEKCHHEAKNIRKQLHALVVSKFDWLIYLADDV